MLLLFFFCNTAYQDNDGGYFILENQNLKATFNHDGQLINLLDKKTPDRLEKIIVIYRAKKKKKTFI